MQNEALSTLKVSLGCDPQGQQCLASPEAEETQQSVVGNTGRAERAQSRVKQAGAAPAQEGQSLTATLAGTTTLQLPTKARTEPQTLCPSSWLFFCGVYVSPVSSETFQRQKLMKHKEWMTNIQLRCSKVG